MAFYSDFAGEYEKIFPLREGTLDFLDRWLPEDGRILDLGCGTGHYCGRLAGTGRDCLGVDLDPGMIIEAEKNYAKASFQILDLRDVRVLRPNSFSGIFCIGNVLPHLPSGELQGFLASVFKLLKPGGHWIFQTVNFDPLLHLDEYCFPDLEFPDIKMVFQRKYLSDPRGHLIFQTKLVRDELDVFSGETPLYPSVSSDYQSIHQIAGFKMLAHFADFTGRDFESGRSTGSVFVFEKS